jgi:hypothetical protein
MSSDMSQCKCPMLGLVQREFGESDIIPGLCRLVRAQISNTGACCCQPGISRPFSGPGNSPSVVETHAQLHPDLNASFKALSNSDYIGVCVA